MLHNTRIPALRMALPLLLRRFRIRQRVYRVATVPRGGAVSFTLTSFPTLNAAMESVRPQLRNRLISDAWVEDQKGKRHADLKRIRRHCQLFLPRAQPVPLHKVGPAEVDPAVAPAALPQTT